jgi:hypothetical protein
MRKVVIFILLPDQRQDLLTILLSSNYSYNHNTARKSKAGQRKTAAREEILEILFFAIIFGTAFLSCNPSAYGAAGASRQTRHPADAPF